MRKILKRILWWVPFGRVPEIDARALATLGGGEAPYQILDVRTRWEWRRSRIPNARHVRLASLRERLPELGLDRGRPVVAVCLSAHRSIAAVRLLKSLGFSDVCQLKGGMKAWWRAGLPTEGSGSRSRNPSPDGGLSFQDPLREIDEGI